MGIGSTKEKENLFEDFQKREVMFTNRGNVTKLPLETKSTEENKCRVGAERLVRSSERERNEESL